MDEQLQALQAPQEPHPQVGVHSQGSLLGHLWLSQV